MPSQPETPPTSTSTATAGNGKARLRRASPGAHKRTRRWLKRGVVAAAVVGFVAIIIYAWLPEPIKVDRAVVSRGPLEVFAEDDGRTRVRERYVVSAPITGNLIRVELEPGAAVAEGDALARLYPPTPALLDARSRSEAEAQLAAALAQGRQADSAVARARAARELAGREAARANALASTGALAEAERDRAVLADRVAAEDLASADLGRRVAAAQVATARAVLGQVVRGEVSDVSVVAPAAGRVLRIFTESAGPVAAGTPLIEIGDPAAIEVVVDVLSSDAVRIAAGAPVWIEEWGGDAPLTGRVRVVEPAAFMKISALGVEEQRVNVVVALDQPPPGVGDGFRVEARIQTWKGADVVTAPASAVFRDRDGWAVYRIVDGRARLTRVDVGHRARAAVEVVSGLEVGAEVIIYPGDRVRDGVAVAARE